MLILGQSSLELLVLSNLIGDSWRWCKRNILFILDHMSNKRQGRLKRGHSPFAMLNLLDLLRYYSNPPLDILIIRESITEISVVPK